MAPPSPWSDEAVRMLRELWPTTASAEIIAKALTDAFGEGFTRNSVLGRAWRMNLPLRAKSPNGNRVNGQSKPRKPRKPMILPFKKYEPPKPLPPERPKPPVMRKLSFFELGNHHCKWPLGDSYAPARLFCGADQEEGRPYCSWHTRIAYHKLTGG